MATGNGWKICQDVPEPGSGGAWCNNGAHGGGEGLSLDTPCVWPLHYQGQVLEGDTCIGTGYGGYGWCALAVDSSNAYTSWAGCHPCPEEEEEEETAAPTPAPTIAPTPAPTPEPTPEPTLEPTTAPTAAPTEPTTPAPGGPPGPPGTPGALGPAG